MTLVVSVELETITATGYESFGTSHKPDAILINFPPKSNSTKTSRHLYLPPEEEQLFIPEVIDNRVRFSTSGFRPLLPSTSSFAINPSPDPGLRTRPLLATEQPFRHNFFRPNTPLKSSTSGSTGFTGISGVSQIDPVPGKQFGDFYVQVNSMSCLNTGEEIFFRVSMRPPRETERPIIDGVVSDACRIERINDEYRINFGNELFRACGVQDCSNDREHYYCLNVRFPVISGLRLKEDHKVTLRCKTQDKTASHTKRVNVKTLDT